MPRWGLEKTQARDWFHQIELENEMATVTSYEENREVILGILQKLHPADQQRLLTDLLAELLRQIRSAEEPTAAAPGVTLRELFEILRTAPPLPADELQAWAEEVNALRAQQAAPHLTRDETALLLEINSGLPAELQERFEELVSRREAGTITDSELQELISLTERVEHSDAERLRALAELAELRQTTLPDLMNTLGLWPVGDAGRADK